MPGTDVSIGIVEDSDDDFAAFARVVRRDAPTSRLQRWSRADTALDSLTGQQDPDGDRPSILIIDLNLPGMDGAELVRRLRASPSTATLPMFILSGSGRQQDIDRCYAVGANAYLTKPSNSLELSTLLQMLLQSLAIFKAPTATAAGPFDAVAEPAAQRTVDGHRDQYERQLLADRDAERRARVRAEALERLAARLGNLMTAAEVETAITGELMGGDVVQRVELHRLPPTAPAPALSFVADPTGPGMLGTLPLVGASTVFGSLRIETGEPLGDDAQSFLGAAAVLAGRALDRTAKIASLGRASRGDGTGLPSQQWWAAVLEAELRAARAAEQRLTLVLVELPGLQRYSLEHGQSAGDRALLRILDAWRASGHELFSRFGGEEFAALFPGRGYRDAGRIARDLGAGVGSGLEVVTAVAEWNGRDTAAQLTARAEAVMAATVRLATTLRPAPDHR